MDIQLISGTFTVTEAEQLLSAIFQTKISFHQNKIRVEDENEEDIKHSERRILQLEETLRNAIRKMKGNGQTHATLNAHIEVNAMPL